MEELFAPPGEAWQRVSENLRKLHRTVVLVLAAGYALAAFVVFELVLHQDALAVIALAVAAVAAWAGWVLAARQQHAWGYAERAEDLFVTSGVMVRQLVAVPYGRMQFVDVTAGPLDRAFGIATVTLHTATPATDAKIPGLRPPEAARLRDRLTELGEARSAGL